jgi:hypothetical protein
MLAKRCLPWKGELTCAAQGVAAAFSTGFGCGIGGRGFTFDLEIRKFAAKNLKWIDFPLWPFGGLGRQGTEKM